MESFSLDDYDCIGFDLDCTLAEYDVNALMKLIYEILAEYMVKKKFYNGKFLLRPFEDEEYFLQKGLFIHMQKGNILKIADDGTILKATHGTKCLNDDSITKIYGPMRTFSALTESVNNPLSVNNITDKKHKHLRTCLDVFDTPCFLLYARIVDSLDEKNGAVLDEYNIWPDILEGLFHLYDRNQSGESYFFSALKKNPKLYYKKWTEEKLAWLKEIKSKKFVYLLTDSPINFATYTSTFCISEDWKDYFDVIICFARKPYFFTADHQFLKTDDGEEQDAVDPTDLKINSVYCGGNWKGLKFLIKKQMQKEEPKCLYIGDNLLLDMFAPVKFKACDSVAVSVELKSELNPSKLWGSYYKTNKRTTFWNKLIQSNAKICISSLNIFLSRPFNFRYQCLKSNGDEILESNGYFST